MFERSVDSQRPESIHDLLDKECLRLSRGAVQQNVVMSKESIQDFLSTWREGRLNAGHVIDPFSIVLDASLQSFG